MKNNQKHSYDILGGHEHQILHKIYHHRLHEQQVGVCIFSLSFNKYTNLLFHFKIFFLCIEDVFLEVLRMGKTLTWKDIEGEGEYTRSITLKEVHERVAKMPTKHLMDFINENDDAVTAYVLLQQVFFDEQIFC